MEIFVGQQTPALIKLMENGMTMTPPAPARFAISPEGATCSPGAAVHARSALRDAVARVTRPPEAEALSPLLAKARLDGPQAVRADALARQWVKALRAEPVQGGRAGRVQALMQEYALSTEEGVALMCLAEALLRIPDDATRDVLIRDKIGRGQWQQHLGQSGSPFVNAASWGLLLTGKLVSAHSQVSLGGALVRLISRGGEPVIRKGMELAMQMLGEQFVTGQTIAQALERSREMEAQGFRYSYDMLGEAALTDEDARRYFAAYQDAIHAIGRSANGRGVLDGPGISIKLSALHPRYTRSQRDRVMQELLPRVLTLAELACQYDIGLNIDAEESERLDLSLDLLEALCLAPSLAGWGGIGFVVQAYQKRCTAVIDLIVDLARCAGRRLMVRLVKGAYWDSEIKRAQAEGLADYPVYTRKHHTDIAYLACARRMLSEPEAIFPQFATHNAHTVASIVCMAHELRGAFAHGQYEFQCLHGMGEGLYRQVVTHGEQARPCRIYAPVGTHETLLAYLVRRLLENGANSSFVHRIADPGVSIDELLKCPAEHALEEADQSGQAPGQPHPAIPLPSRLYGSARLNSQGLDLAHEPTLERLSQQMSACLGAIAVAPVLANPVATPASTGTGDKPVPLRNPADPADLIGTVRQACAAEVEAALTSATEQAGGWARTAPAVRADLLERAADPLQSDAARCLALLIREAGKTWPHAVAELREAVDFLRYYAAQVRRDFDNATHPALGPVVCISPWNFPLAIFTGQVAAALAAGNTVLAKPAEQTPAIAALAVQALWKAGVSQSAVQLLPGTGAQVGQALVADARVQGVMFTGSTQTARLLQATLSRRLDARGQPVTFIAETGGQNCMVVDSSALLEQVAADAAASAFEAAGQRCSALRVLCVQEDVAPRLIDMLLGAMAELRLDVPTHLHADVGPVIDERARAAIEAHVDAMRAKGRRVHRLVPIPAEGTRVVPTLIEIDRIDELQREVFGPVLHVLRWRRDQLDSLLQDIEATGYALTLGVHSRIDEMIEQVVQNTSAGNVYVNRNMVGAVVGVQPFGGHGLSGTGPKAGGPLYLLRLVAQCPEDAALSSVRSSGAPHLADATPALSALHRWALDTQRPSLADACMKFAVIHPSGLEVELAGITGESNLYQVRGRQAITCRVGRQATAEDDALVQLAAVLAVGGQVLWPKNSQTQAWRDRLPKAVQERVWLESLDAASPHPSPCWLVHASTQELEALVAKAASRSGPIISFIALQPGEVRIPLHQLMVERSISTNTAAAGGNASLMMAAA